MEFRLNVTRWTVLKVSFVILLLFGAFFAGATQTIPTAYKKGYEEGYVKALSDVNDILGQNGIAFSWQDLGDGKYLLSVTLEGKLYAQGVAEVHLWIEHWRDGVLLSSEFGAGVLTDIGKDWIEQQISGTSSDNQTIYCADSNNASAPSASWTILPNEITANGLDRQAGTYTSTGTGTWNVSVTKSVTGTQSTQLWGLHWSPDDNSDNNLMAADSTPSQKNCVNGDTLKETWQITVS